MTYTMPVANPYIRRGAMNNTYGPVRRNADGTVRNHQGWDFWAPVGTEVFAVAPGVVVDVSTIGDYGLTLTLELDHPTPTGARFAFYAHLSDAARVGLRVSEGDVVGRSGESGNARGMAPADQHLHFEARTERNPGRGLAGRLSPGVAFGWRAPLHRDPG